MTNILEEVRDWFAPVHPLPTGLYHYISPADDARNYRLHLRIEADGSGILIVNASTILHLNPTAAELAYYIVQNLPPEEAARKLTKRYHVTKDQALEDYQNLVDRIQTLVNTPDLDPETFLDFERKSVRTTMLSAPYRLDCALTYRLPEGSDPASAPTERVRQELSTQEWMKIIDTSQTRGIPHLVFTGGEPTLREDLPQLIEFAEEKGLVTGIITDGKRFSDAQYLEHVLQMGLDHIMVVLNPTDEQGWMALERLIAADIFVAVHITIDSEMMKQVNALLDRFVNLGVRAISLSINHAEIQNQLEIAREMVAARHLELVWDLPVPYSALNPITFETQAEISAKQASQQWLYVEPDGDVLPAQGINQVLGNLLQDPWDKIWKR
jgi:organic radical activating enzyme